MDVSWDDVRLFLAIADHGSLTEAARQLKVGQPTVRRRLAELEESLGYPLLARSVDGNGADQPRRKVARTGAPHGGVGGRAR